MCKELTVFTLTKCSIRQHNSAGRKVTRTYLFMTMDNTGYHAVIKYFQLKGQIPTAIHADMLSTSGDEVPTMTSVKRWTGEFKRGRESLENDPKSE